jgi:hypothetical protein
MLSPAQFTERIVLASDLPRHRCRSMTKVLGDAPLPGGVFLGKILPFRGFGFETYL